MDSVLPKQSSDNLTLRPGDEKVGRLDIVPAGVEMVATMSLERPADDGGVAECSGAVCVPGDWRAASEL